MEGADSLSIQMLNTVLHNNGDFRSSQSHSANGLVVLGNEWIFGRQMHLF